MIQYLRNYVLPICFVTGLALCWTSSVYAQHNSKANDSQIQWFNAGFGISSSGSSRGGSFSYPTERGIISLRFVYNSSDADPSPSFLRMDPYRKTVWDAGVLSGKMAKSSYGIAFLSGGIGVVGGVLDREYVGIGSLYSPSEFRDNRFLTIGIPIEGQLFWTPYSFLGVGLYGFANINPEESFAGALLGIQMGKLR